MTTDIDIYRTANLLIKEHGDTAAIEAAMRAGEMLEKGDLDGQAVWLRVLEAVKVSIDKQLPEDGGWCTSDLERTDEPVSLSLFYREQRR